MMGVSISGDESISRESCGLIHGPVKQHLLRGPAPCLYIYITYRSANIIHRFVILHSN
jgi:hypothetical protein